MSYVVFGIALVLQPGEWTFGKTTPPRGQQQRPPIGRSPRMDCALVLKLTVVLS